MNIFKFFAAISLTICFMHLPAESFAQMELIIKGKIEFPDHINQIEFGIVKAKQKEQLLKIIPIKNKLFEFKIKVKGAETYFLRYNHQINSFNLGPGVAKIFIKDTLLSIVNIQANLSYKEQNDYITQLRSDTNFTKARIARVKRDDYEKSDNVDLIILERKNKIYKELNILSKKTQFNHFSNWLKNHPNSWNNSKMLFELLEIIPDSLIKRIYKNMPTMQKNNSWAKLTKYWIDSLTMDGVFPEDIFYNTNEDLTKLTLKSNHRYTLIDFWASWCIPCRNENPFIVSVYKKYGNDGFGVISVSVDRDKEAWLHAIKIDNLEWTQIRGESLVVFNKYLMKSIPANYLLDQNGKIIAKNISAAALDLFLENNLSLQ